MIKRIFLFFITNIAIIVLLGIVLAIVENVFGIKLSGIGQTYLNIFIYAIIIGFAGSFISLFLSKWTAKRAYNIKLINQYELSSISRKERLVFDIVYDLSNKHGIKLPEVGIYESREPNAFATGATKNSSLVAVSTGLLNIMEENEIKGVVGHEMSHIFNGDMVTMVLLQGVMNTFVIFLSRVIANIVNSYFSKDEEGNGGYFIYYIVSMILEIVLGILASIIVMGFSRYREYKADEGSARLIGKENMIAGLKALKKMISSTSGDNSKLATMKISTKTKGGLLALFSSHPDIDDRIEALERLTI
ncbi:MAG: protease HtpX [Candidatus Gracilibacteria bacterium]|nr:protease HtpX [Candidatus Gracilibacteria bacterium]